MSGGAANAFCCVRPPGHHAEPDKAMGFCFFNNAPIGALHAKVLYMCMRQATKRRDYRHRTERQTHKADRQRSKQTGIFGAMHNSLVELASRFISTRWPENKGKRGGELPAS